MKEITKDQFNEKSTHPLQSWEWGEFRKSWGNSVVRFDFGQITVHKIPFSPFKIAVFEKGPKPTAAMLSTLKNFARKENVMFIKLEPNVKNDKNTVLTLKKYGCIKGRRLFTPTTFWIDLKPSEEEMLKSFSSKTRYNIKVAQKHGVGISEDNSDSAFEKYLSLTRQTIKRQGFYAHSEKYHRLMWKYLNKDLSAKKQTPIARLLVAKYRGEIITTWIVFVWKDFIYYPYGASSDKYKNVMANNLIMWEAIKYGKSKGCKTFDLWGREEGKGFTRFKEGYNPKVVESAGSWDLVTSPFYYPYRLLEVFRWLILRTKSKITKPAF